MRSALGWGTIMRSMRFSKILLSFLVFLGVFLVMPRGVWALDTCPGAKDGIGVVLTTYQSGLTHTISFDKSFLNPDWKYYLKVKNSLTSPDDAAQSPSFRIDTPGNKGGGVSVTSDKISWTISSKEALQDSKGRDMRVILYSHNLSTPEQLCEVGSYTPSGGDYTCGNITVWQGTEGVDACYAGGCLSVEKTTYFRVENMTYRGQPFSGNVLPFIGEAGWYDMAADGDAVFVSNGLLNRSFTPHKENTYYLSFGVSLVGPFFSNCEVSFDVRNICGNSCNKSPTHISSDTTPFSLCSQLQVDTEAYDSCIECAAGSNDKDDGQAGVWTAIGCIKRDPTSIMQRFITLGLGIGGGVSLLSTLAGGFILTTSQGDPKRTGQAKEMITNAVIGLIFVIFSVTILQFIGYTVFRLPGFGE